MRASVFMALFSAPVHSEPPPAVLEDEYSHREACEVRPARTEDAEADRCEGTFSSAPFDGMAPSRCDAEATETVVIESTLRPELELRLCASCAADARRRMP